MIQRISQQIQPIRNLSIDDLLRECEIEIFFDERMNNKKNDTFLDTSQGKKTLFIKTDLEKNYENFVILHEV